MRSCLATLAGVALFLVPVCAQDSRAKVQGTVTQANIATDQLLRPYPQYGALTESLIGGLDNRYKALQVQVQRPFTNGFNFVLGHNYNSERNQEF